MSIKVHFHKTTGRWHDTRRNFLPPKNEGSKSWACIGHPKALKQRSLAVVCCECYAFRAYCLSASACLLLIPFLLEITSMCYVNLINNGK